MPGEISTVTVTGSTSVVWAVCSEAVPGDCMCSVAGTLGLCPLGWKSLSKTRSTALYTPQILCFESV